MQRITKFPNVPVPINRMKRNVVLIVATKNPLRLLTNKIDIVKKIEKKKNRKKRGRMPKEFGSA